MGHACFMARELEKRNLRKFSWPFDWVFGSAFEERRNLFINKFDRYFEKKDLEYICTGLHLNTDVYKNTITGPLYNHDFKQHGNFNSEYPLVRDKYDRRVKRVLNKIKNGKRVLIIYEEVRAASTPSLQKITELVKMAKHMKIK
jgi:hypothetical protein